MTKIFLTLALFVFSNSLLAQGLPSERFAPAPGAASGKLGSPFNPGHGTPMGYGANEDNDLCDNAIMHLSFKGVAIQPKFNTELGVVAVDTETHTVTVRNPDHKTVSVYTKNGVFDLADKCKFAEKTKKGQPLNYDTFMAGNYIRGLPSNLASLPGVATLSPKDKAAFNTEIQSALTICSHAVNPLFQEAALSSLSDLHMMPTAQPFAKPSTTHR